MSAKDFEEECCKVIKGIHGVQYLEEQGSCQYTSTGTRYCPDIVGVYQAAHNKSRKGFVVECKHYSSKRSTDEADCEKLQRDVDETKKYLQQKKLIGAIRSVVKGIFVTSEGRGTTAEEQGFTVITVGKAGSPHWKGKLINQFTKAMS